MINVSDIYNDMNAQMQTIADAMVSGLDFTSPGLDTAESIENYITDYILNPLYNSGPEIRATFAEITDWKEELKNGEISFEEFSERVEKAFDDLIDSMDEEEVGKFKDNFVAGFNAIGIEGRSFNAVVDGIIESWGKLSSVPQVDAKGAIGDLADGLSDLKKAYDLLNTAQEEMAIGRGLSADTIASLAAAEENYLDYLYEENGVIKLNTEAWKENANARMKNDMSIIWDEIEALEEKNAALREQLKIIAEAKPIDLSSLSNLPGIGGLLGNSEWAQKQAEQIFENLQKSMFEKINGELGDNIAIIEEYMAKLSMISSLYESIAGQLESTFSAFDSYTSGMANLADLQELVANGYTVAADKVRELAAVYPEILEAAEHTASGQIRLNEDVVNSVLEGKRFELDGTIDAEIGKLKAKRALLQAELDIINQQVAAAESGDDATVASANEAAGAQMAIAQAVLTACEQAGIDEKTANEMALAAMTGEWDDFRELAEKAVYELDDESATAFTSVMNNFATMARNVVNNTNEIIGAYSRMGEALQNAMNGLTTGKYNASINGGSVYGSGKQVVEGILTDMFDSARSDYGSGGTTLDNQMDVWQQRLQAIADTYANNKADISDLLAKQASLVNQIASVDGQIELLRSLKNAPINSFKSGSSSSSSGSSSSTKEVEEYIVDIDKYREALERLRKAQENTERIEQEIERIQYARIVPQEDIDALNAENALLSERNRLLEDTLGAIEYYNEVQREVSELNIDPNNTVFGNIDLNNRQALEWTDDMLNQYQDAIKSWGASAEDLAGSISTVLGTWNEFDGVPIAFSPLLQTEDGPVYLDSNTAHNYIRSLIEKAGEGWSFDQIFYLDAEGLEVNGRRIQNLIADIGDTAEATASSMHYLGTDGAIQGSFEEISAAAEQLGVTVEELIAQYDALNAEYDINEQKINSNQAALTAYENAIRSEFDIIRNQINLRKELIISYNQQQQALHNLNNQRDATITEGTQTLRDLGFAVQYNADTNELWISNMEHINELVADNKGEYDTLQEATNALRKETENLINSLEDLNDENRECSATWWELQDSIRDAKIAIVDDLKEIVDVAHDAVDEIQNVYDTLKDAADEYAENGGFISIDTLQSIYKLGVQYMQYLEDENGLLVINEENINKVIAAKTRQLAAEQALTYVERLRLALQEDSIESLNTLLYATEGASDATFGLAYAELALMHQLGELDDQQYAAALHNIQAIEALANTAIASIGQTASSAKEELENMKSGIDDILKYVMDMLKHRIQQQIDALEDMKDAYSDLIDLRKEALDAAKKEADYEDKVAEKIKEMAKLQERINALSLDDSRDAQAQKAKLEEELAELQKELADEQNDYVVDAQKDALDDMEEAYKKEKDAEIAALEETISSYQKLYDMAIAYIENHWDTLYQELIAWNTEYGSVLNSEITTAWENCLAAAQRYGSYVAALNSIDNDITAAGSNSPSNNTVVSTTGNSSASTKEDNIHAIIKEMYANSQEWMTASASRKAELDNRNLVLGSMLSQYGINAHRENGAWYVNGNELLYDKYKKYIYHKGGIAGDNPDLKQNEIMAVLEKGEMVLDKQKEQGLYRLIDFTSALSEKLSRAIGAIDLSGILDVTKNGADSTSAPLSAVTNNQNDNVHFGDVYIYGASEETARQHQEINRKFTNEVLSQLRIKR